MDLMQSTSVRMDERLKTVCNEVFELVCAVGATRLKHPMLLATLINLGEEENMRIRQKTETIMDEIRNVRKMLVCVAMYVNLGVVS